MIDDHTKAILTVIAASLLILAVQQVVRPASAAMRLLTRRPLLHHDHSARVIDGARQAGLTNP